MICAMSSTDSSATATPHVYTDADYEPWITHDNSTFVRVVRLLTSWFWDHVYRLEAHGVERLPEAGAFVMTPNHSSYADPFIHVRPIKRLVRFMAKASMFEYPVMRSFMKGGGAFPVRRGKGDVFAMELARRLLRAGEPVVVYPEGTRFRRSFELGPAKRGAFRLALETGVPVVPAASWGVKDRSLYGRRRWQRPRTVVVYGEPIDTSAFPDTPEGVDALRDTAWSRVQELYDEARVLAERHS
jgi:1-acyl-sn-glycerol-3-phosphate acyltransferase